MKHARRLIAMLVVVLCAKGLVAEEMFSQSVGPVRVRPVTAVSPLRVPFIIWGGDMATFHANGGLKTKPGTIFQKLGLNLQLEPGDDFHQQVRDYMEGKSPFLRGTYRMIGMASDVIGSDPRTRGVVFLQMTWSAGDHMVGRRTIEDAADLRGKTVALQSGGPHVGMLDDILKDAGLNWDDIKVVWAKDLTATPDSPAEMFRKNPAIDACFVITPDMIGLCGGLDHVGTGAEGTVEKARVVVSTTQLSRSIADVYVCRKDFFDANKDMVTKFVAGYLHACERVTELRNDFEAKKSSAGDKAEYMRLLKLSQDIYTTDVMPTLDEDAHGLLLDCSFVGYPGNWKFFRWGEGNVVGFESFNKKAIELAVTRGYARVRRDLLCSEIDYDSRLFAALKEREKPTFETGGEITDDIFGEDGPQIGSAIVTFTINFLPNQTDFSARQYGTDFERVVQMASKYGNAAFVIRGHSDPTLTLKNLVDAGVEKDILKVSVSGGERKYYLNGRPINLNSIDTIVKLIGTGAFDGVKEADPKKTMQAAKSLSLRRAENVRDSIIKYAQDRGLLFDRSQLAPQGVGVTEPLIPKPRNMAEAKDNMRVEFSLVPVQAEVKSASMFDF